MPSFSLLYSSVICLLLSSHYSYAFVSSTPSIKIMALKRRSSSRINSTPAMSGGGGDCKNNCNDDTKRSMIRSTTNKKQKRGNNNSNDNNSSGIKKSHWSRPGVEAAARLVSLPIESSASSSSLNSWNTALSQYDSMIRAKGNTQLYNLDQQRDRIAQQWKADSQMKQKNNKRSAGMTKDELLNVIIPWKFLKGKPRNALKPLLQSNTDESVIKASILAFNHADNAITTTNDDNQQQQQQIQNAIQSLCQLSGVGPATASAILSASHPQLFAFMDDEVIECLYDAKRGYTAKIYGCVNERCRGIARELNEVSGGGEWTPADVGKALWTVATMSARKDEVGLGKVFG